MEAGYATESDFNWLRRDERGPTYISYSYMSHRSACAFEYGEKGHAASCNYGGELIHLSAPSAKHGLIFARGGHSTSLQTLLSRAQSQFGGPCTFGLEVSRQKSCPTPNKNETGKPAGSSFRPGKLIERGCFNYRWPFHEYVLLANNLAGFPSGREPEPVGTYSVVACVKDGVCYQIMRLEMERGVDGIIKGAGDRTAPRQVALTIGGDVFFRSFEQCDKGRCQTAKSSNGPPGDAVGRAEGHGAKIEDGSTIRNIVDSDLGVGLEMQVFHIRRGGVPRPTKLYESKREVDISTHRGPGKAYNVYATLDGEDLTTDDGGSQGYCSAVFVAALRLYNTSTPADPKPPSVESLRGSKDFFEHVGVDPNSVKAAGSMWVTTFVEDERRHDEDGCPRWSPMSIISEVHLVGRCVEKVLEVEMCPAMPRASTTKKRNAGEAGTQEPEHITMVSNLFTQPNVDLKAMFWKCRFLVKLDNFLEGFGQGPGQCTRTRVARAVRDSSCTDPDAYCRQLTEMRQRIRGCLMNVMEYLLSTLLDPNSTRNSLPVLMPDSFVRGESNYYYVTLTIWYAIWVLQSSLDLLSKYHGVLSRLAESESGPKAQLFHPGRLPHPNFNFPHCDKEKVSLLKWYHRGALLMLVKCADGRMDGKMDSKFSMLGRAAKTTSATKLSSERPYDTNDEIFDRLALIVSELGFDKLDPNGPEIIESLSIKRIKQRVLGAPVNPGDRDPHENDKSISAPWEVHALCHHSQFMAMVLEMNAEQPSSGDDEAEDFIWVQKQLCQFLDAEGTLMPCWERAYSNAKRGWLRSEATSVFASTLIDCHGKRVLTTESQNGNVKDEEVDAPNEVNMPNLKGEANGDQGEPQKAPSEKQTSNPRKANTPKSTGHQGQRFGAMEGKTPDPPPIDWIAIFAPPSTYHPDGFVDSLADTPWVYNPRLSKGPKVAIQGTVKKYMTEWDPKWPSPTLTAEALKVILDKPRNFPRPLETSEDERETSTMMTIEDIGSEVDAHNTDNVDGVGQNGAGSSNIGPPMDILEKLVHNLVDQGVQHRFLVVRWLPDGFLDYLLYVIHPQAAAGFNNHLLELSRFSCQRQEKWIADITVKSWTKMDALDEFKFKAPTRVFSLDPLRAHDNSTKDPCEIADSHRIKLSKSKGVVLYISSISMVTNRFGDFSKCLIISPIFGDRDVAKVAKKAKVVWRKFAHHPQTGRCLVFLLVLGALCRKMAKEYEASVDYVDKFKAINDVNDSLDMLKNDPELKAIYNVEGQLMDGVLHDPGGDVATYWLRGTKRSALNRMRMALNECVACSLQAKQVLKEQMQEYSEARQLSPELEDLCQWYLGTFDKDHTRLAVVSAQLEGLMESIDRSMEVFSNVATMIDSKTALTQSKTIQKLTYLTIAYLPLGLLTAIFAIPKEQKAVAEEMGAGWYIGGLLIMFSVTTLAAIYIDELLFCFRHPKTSWEKIKKRVEEWRKKPKTPELPGPR